MLQDVLGVLGDQLGVYVGGGGLDGVELGLEVFAGLAWLHPGLLLGGAVDGF